MVKKIKSNIVFWCSLVSLVVLMAISLTDISGFMDKSQSMLTLLLTNFSWFYAGVVLLFLYLCLYLLFSKYGSIKLGRDNDEAEYSFLSWLSMLFSAGMGIGLIFWGIAEPLNHYLNPMNGTPLTHEAKVFAMEKSFLHWGLSAWSCYAVLALALAYFQFRKRKPALMSSVLSPILGENKSMKHVVDIFTIFATVAGVVTSLGLGTLQINAGLNYLFHVPENTYSQLIIVGLVTIAFLISAVKGLDSGIQKLSNVNMIFAALLLFLAIFIGPTLKISENFLAGLVYYAKDLVTTNNNIFAQGTWYQNWTIFYWGWWIAWAPPVAIFIARISKGRTIKEFLTGVLIVPSILCFIWFATFGTIAFNVDASVANLAVQKTETALFVVMSHYNLGFILSILAIFLLGTFFITSADSATFVLGMLSSKGNLDPKTSRKVTWGIIQAVITVVFLMAGGLEMIKTASIVAAFPFAFIMLLAAVSLMKSLREEFAVEDVKEDATNEELQIG